MSIGQKLSRFIFYSVFAVLMTVSTYILGGVPLKVLRQQAGRLVYWVSMTAVSLGFYAYAPTKPIGVMFFSLVVLIGTFSEFEELHLSFSMTAFFTVLINTLIVGGTFALWVSRIGPRWLTEVQNAVDVSVKQLATVNTNLPANYGEMLLQLIPSAVLIMWIITIYLAVLLEGRLLPQLPTATSAVPTETDKTSMRAQLFQLRMPDVVVWILILGLLGAFGGFAKKPVEIVSINVLNVCGLLFMLQGIAVIARFFERLRMGAFWQTLFLILIVVNLFLFVSALGLLDYWLDIRARMDKRPQEYNRET